MRVEAFGGPWDGNVMEIPDDNEYIRFAVLPDGRVGGASGTMLTETVTYPIEGLPDGRKVVVAPLYWPGQNF